MRTKRTLSLVLAIIMVISLFVPFAGTTYAKGTTLENSEVIDSEIKNVDKEKFTHKEWMGIEYTDIDGNNVKGENVFGINREEATVSKIPYQDELTAKNAVWDYNAREKSSYFELLTGSGKNWELTVVQNQEEANKFMSKENGFMTKSFVKKQEDGWKDVELPKSWTSFGFDFSIYTNVQMPWQTKYDANVKVPNAPTVYNPVGLYRKTFKVDPSYVKDGRRVYLSFEGVESDRKSVV